MDNLNEEDDFVKYSTQAAILAIISIFLILLGAAALLPPQKVQKTVQTYSPGNLSVQFAMLEKPPAPSLTPYAVVIKPSTPVSTAVPATLVAALSQFQQTPAPAPKQTVAVPQSSTPKSSPTQTYILPQIPSEIPKSSAQPSLPSTIYTFTNLSNIPNFQSLVNQMRRDYIRALSNLPNEIAYTLAGTVKGIVGIQKDGSVKVIKIISSPSVVLTDIYVRNIEQFVTFPRSYALEGIEIDTTFTPSASSVSAK